ncbi:MAG: sterol desaturase family protein [Spirosomataceae bacterium]
MAPNLILYAVPIFIATVILEAIIVTYQQRDYIQTKDTFTSLAMGIGNLLTGLITKTPIWLLYVYLYEHFRVFTLSMDYWWVWVLAFFADDFSYYWFHREAHLVRWFWASHVVHHSSQKYNLATALRQTWTGNLTGSFIFYLWMPIVGFHPVTIVTMQQISLLYQYWIHTETIGKLWKPIEFVFNTPSHHRVHHASDLQYLDKNYAGILIIWDRLFGTFIEEDERPTYGLTKNINTYNPVRVAFNEWISIGNDLLKAGSLKNAIGYLFNPPGWSHDGSRKTTQQLREEAKKAT